MKRSLLVGAQAKPDQLYLSMIGLMTAVAMSTFVLGLLVDFEWLTYRRGALALSLIAAFGLFMRGRRHGRWIVFTCGALILVACGLQLAYFVARGPAPPEYFLPLSVTQSFASGMLCIGAALVLDSLLPAQWGRHLLFGLLGAVAAMMGAAGAFAVFSGLSLALDETLLDGMRLPGSTILLMGGLSLLIGARLRSASAAESQEHSFASEELRDRSGLAAALTVLLVTLGATLLLWRQVQEQNRREFEAEQVDALDRLASALAANTRDTASLLDGVRGLFAASEHVDPDEWLRYFDQLAVADHYTGVILVGYAARLRLPEPGSAARNVVRLAGSTLTIWPAGDHTMAYPTIYVVPRNETTLPMLGFDLGSDPVLSESVAVAERTGQLSISGHFDVGRLNGPGSREGIIAVMPLPERLDVADAGSTTSIGISGIAYCALDMEAIVAHSTRESGSDGLAVLIVDDAPSSAGSPLYRSVDFDVNRPFVTTRRRVGERDWTISAQFGAAAAAAVVSRNPGAVLSGGLFAALVLFALTWVLTGHRARALHLARQINRQLGRAQKAQQAVTDTAKAGIITADSDGRILYMNPAAATEFGVDGEGMIGLPLTRLMPERYRQAHQEGIARVAAGGERHVIGKAQELTGLRADGSEFPIEILLSAWTSEDQQFFTAFVTDITERRHAQTELTRRAQELERSNADLEQFAYVASHDLQEPLRMVASYVQLLARRYRGRLDEDADEFIGFAVDGATRMQNLIEDLLAFARVGRSGLRPVATDVKASAEAAVALLQEAINQSGAKIEVNLACSVLAVPSQLTQVFQNLLANALKFRGEKTPEISIDALEEGAGWHVRVADNGIGIAQKHGERIFAIFQRLHTRKEYSGTGIGLAICRRIIDSFGGRIWVESTPGAGSIFHFVLPKSGETS